MRKLASRKADLDIANAELNITNQKAALVRADSQVKDAKRKLDHAGQDVRG